MQKLIITIAPDSTLEMAQLVRFEGDFDGSAQENLEEIQKLIESIPVGTVMIFDFSNLNYLNSFALSQMVSWHNVIEAKGGKILIVGTNDHVKDIFMVLGVDTIFKTYNTLEEAKGELL